MLSCGQGGLEDRLLAGSEDSPRTRRQPEQPKRRPSDVCTISQKPSDLLQETFRPGQLFPGEADANGQFRIAVSWRSDNGGYDGRSWEGHFFKTRPGAQTLVSAEVLCCGNNAKPDF